MVTATSARELTLQTLLSGPVGGTMGGVLLARLLRRPNLICIDMGGTSFDVSLVVNGAPDVPTETEIEGFPLLMPVVNIHTIGAGGGSVAYEEAGGLRVGPKSAGAEPGAPTAGAGPSRRSPTPTWSWAASTRPTSPGCFYARPRSGAGLRWRASPPVGLEPPALAEGIRHVVNAKNGSGHPHAHGGKGYRTP